MYIRLGTNMPLCVYTDIYIYNDENNATCVNVYAQVSQQLRVECYCLLTNMFTLDAQLFC